MDHRADLWALGVVGYIMVTGDLPFVGETLAATIVAITNHNYRAPSAVGAPPAFDAWFERAFHRDIEQRFQSAKEMTDAFSAACRQQSTAPPRTPPTAAMTHPEAPYIPQQPAARPATPAPHPGVQQPTPAGATVHGLPPGMDDPRLTPIPHHGQRPQTISQPPPAYAGTPVPHSGAMPQTFAGSASTLSGEKKSSAGLVIGGVAALLLAGGGAFFFYSQSNKSSDDARTASSSKKSEKKKSKKKASAKPSAEPALPPPPEGHGRCQGRHLQDRLRQGISEALL